MRTIICLGDSLTQGADLDPSRTWPGLADNALAGVAVVNQGIGGDTTGGMLARFPSVIVPAKPDLLLILGGSNDLWFGLDRRIIVANVYALVSQARFHSITPLVATPLPFVADVVKAQPWLPPPGGYGVMAQELAALRTDLARAAESSEVLCLDLYSRFCDADGVVQSRFFLEDGVHPNYPGHQRIARALLAVMQGELLCG